MTETGYLSIGKLAKQVGVTVRTIRYYDQEGLLSPSAKGPQNQRLYTQRNVEDLYRILVLKYLGLSLAEVKESGNDCERPEAFSSMVERRLEDLEIEFQRLFSEMSICRALAKQSLGAECVDWRDAARVIERGQEGADFFWAFTDEAEFAPEKAETESAPERRIAVGKWHELIADVLAFLSAGGSPDDEGAVQIARRYRELEAGNEGSLAQSFVLMENITPHGGADGSFDALRSRVEDFLERASTGIRD